MNMSVESSPLFFSLLNNGKSYYQLYAHAFYSLVIKSIRPSCHVHLLSSLF